MSDVEYNIILQSVRARQCRALTGIRHVNEKRFISVGWSKQAKIAAHQPK